MEMVTINGVRYRVDDAMRRGLLRKPEVPKAKKAPAPKDKVRRMVLNKTVAEPDEEPAPVEPDEPPAIDQSEEE